eukprot:6191347-Pleurochrysis_carterae.AAC.1
MEVAHLLIREFVVLGNQKDVRRDFLPVPAVIRTSCISVCSLPRFQARVIIDQRELKHELNTPGVGLALRQRCCGGQKWLEFCFAVCGTVIESGLVRNVDIAMLREVEVQFVAKVAFIPAQGAINFATNSATGSIQLLQIVP